MDDHGTGVWRVAGLHPAQESQERCGVFGDPMIWPGCKLEVTNFPLLIGAALNKRTNIRVRGNEILVVDLHMCITLFKL